MKEHDISCNCVMCEKNRIIARQTQIIRRQREELDRYKAAKK